MRMPGGWDGLTTIEALWRVSPSLHVAICTAHCDFDWHQINARLGLQVTSMQTRWWRAGPGYRLPQRTSRSLTQHDALRDVLTSVASRTSRNTSAPWMTR